MELLWLILGIGGLALFLGVRTVQQYEKGLIIRLGRYSRTVSSGLIIIIPFIDTLTKMDMREQVINVHPQKVITKDNVSVVVDAVIYFKIIDPVKAKFEIENFALASVTLAQTNLRNLIGEKSLDETLTARENINSNLRNALDQATDSWGIRITRVEVQKIDPPEDITAAMSKQMKAEREKRANILDAEGFKQAEILKAEGVRQSKILTAQGEAEAVKLRADAESKAVELVAVAAEKYFTDNAQTLKRLEVLQHSLEKNTKFVIPSNSNMLSLLDLDKSESLEKIVGAKPKG